jgi:hypothetical protein
MTTKTNDRTAATIRDALRGAGVAEVALEAAEAIFTPKLVGKPTDALAWEFKGSSTTIAKHARRFAEANAFMCGKNPPPSRQGDPTYRDGTPIPFDQLSPEELIDLQTDEDARKALELTGEPVDYTEEIERRRIEARKALNQEMREGALRIEAEKRKPVGGDGHRLNNPNRDAAGRFAHATPEELFDQAGDVK